MYMIAYYPLIFKSIRIRSGPKNGNFRSGPDQAKSSGSKHFITIINVLLGSDSVWELDTDT